MLPCLFTLGNRHQPFGKHKLINALSEKDLNNKDLEKISENEAVVRKMVSFWLLSQ
jgi:hypothetical protein